MGTSLSTLGREALNEARRARGSDPLPADGTPYGIRDPVSPFPEIPTSMPAFDPSGKSISEWTAGYVREAEAYTLRTTRVGPDGRISAAEAGRFDRHLASLEATVGGLVGPGTDEEVALSPLDPDHSSYADVKTRMSLGFAPDAPVTNGELRRAAASVRALRAVGESLSETGADGTTRFERLAGGDTGPLGLGGPLLSENDVERAAGRDGEARELEALRLAVTSKLRIV